MNITGPTKFRNPEYISNDTATLESAWPDIQQAMIDNSSIEFFSVKQLRNKVPAVAGIDAQNISGFLAAKGIDVIPGTVDDQ